MYADYVKQIGPGKQLYLFMMDLDDFKGINDILGHAVGDRALIDTARILKKTAGPHQSIVTRYGGDEFLILGFFEDDADAENFKKTVQKNNAIKQEYIERKSIKNKNADMNGINYDPEISNRKKDDDLIIKPK